MNLVGVIAEEATEEATFDRKKSFEHDLSFNNIIGSSGGTEAVAQKTLIHDMTN